MELEQDRWLDLRQALVDAVNELYEHELITPTGGNLSVRLPESENILITASQIFKGDLGPEHILEVDAQGKQVTSAMTQDALPFARSSVAPGHPGGRKIRPSVESGMHLAIYAARPDVGAVVHTHSPLATVWGLFDEPVPALTMDSIRFTEMRVVPFAAPGSRELATAAAESLARGPAALLRNHGLITVGVDLRDAVNTALALEETLKIVLLARAVSLSGLAGKEPAAIPAKAAEFLKKVLIR
jgi:autoinducer 2 (AI-2) kinase